MASTSYTIHIVKNQSGERKKKAVVKLKLAWDAQSELDVGGIGSQRMTQHTSSYSYFPLSIDSLLSFSQPVPSSWDSTVKNQWPIITLNM